uniref:WRC domain-containing protein n=1 Tax=Arundo donax TaxID=35708 RepID=A0A0A9G205_ARUDO
MRIRRRPQGQPLSSLLLPSDPSAPQPPPNASRDHQERPAGDRKDDLQLHPNAPADLGDEPSSPAARRAALLPLLPQDSVVECRRSHGAQQQGTAADGGHRSLQNGHHNMPEPVIKTEERLVNGVGRGMPVTEVTPNVMTKEENKDDSSGGGGGMKKRRGPAVLLEGSRCSRMNGRGWRCSQPTLVGYALCEHHLGKGRMRSAAAAGRGGASQLGRTEHRKNASTAVTSAPKADVPPPSLRPC